MVGPSSASGWLVRPEGDQSVLVLRSDWTAHTPVAHGSPAQMRATSTIPIVSAFVGRQISESTPAADQRRSHGGS